jgi:hypothetical protein
MKTPSRIGALAEEFIKNLESTEFHRLMHESEVEEKCHCEQIKEEYAREELARKIAYKVGEVLDVVRGLSHQDATEVLDDARAFVWESSQAGMFLTHYEPTKR